jgi:hypothetical protein
LAVRRKKNKKDKHLVSVNRFAICGKFTRALLAHQIFSIQVLLDASNKHKHSTLEKISKILKNFDFLAFFSTFEAETRPSALKILISRRTKVVPDECPHLFKLQLFLIFAYFDFASPK